MESGVWYLRQGTEQRGPLTEEIFEELRDNGSLSPQDWVWHSSWPEWRSCADAFASPPPFPEIHAVASPAASAGEILDDLLIRRLDDIGLRLKESRTYNYVIILREFMRSILQEQRNNTSNSDFLKNQFDAVGNLTDSVAWTLADEREGESDDVATRLKVMWRHRNLFVAFREGVSSKESCSIWVESIAGLAARYLDQPYRSPTLEVMLVDALVANETCAYGEEIKKNPSRFEPRFSLDPFARDVDEMKVYSEAKGKVDAIYTKRLTETFQKKTARLVALGIVPVVAAFWAASQDLNGFAVICGVFAAVVWTFWTLRLIWRILRKIFFKPKKGGLQKAGELFNRMVNVYDELKGGTAMSPRRAREQLSMVANEGAAWNPSVFALLDAAIMRSPGNWS
jgi:hypothetical protein